ncbi:MAG: hypothetical protein KF712_01295 [Akkermansiaceae bacterium]|nr:hypothetical protein [Akkermansiaceae bacterium]
MAETPPRKDARGKDMNAISETGWWIGNLLFAGLGLEESGPDSRVLAVRQMMVTVRCEHWREAFWKARRVGLDGERKEAITIETDMGESIRDGRWQFVGITSLAPLPSIMEDAAALASIQVSRIWLSLRDLRECCIEDYYLEQQVDEARSGHWHRTISDSKKAGF